MSTQIVGNVGLYFVCYELSKRGWNVMPTARNARGIDVVAYGVSASRYLGIQVKALSRKNAVPLGETLERVMGDFWVVIANLETQPAVFVMTPAEVRARAHRTVKAGRSAFWLEPNDYFIPEFAEKWARLGDPGMT